VITVLDSKWYLVCAKFFCKVKETETHTPTGLGNTVLNRCTGLLAQQQQQQQHSLLSQASWGRIEMKPTRHKGHGSGTLIASLQALLSKATSSEICCTGTNLEEKNRTRSIQQ